MPSPTFVPRMTFAELRNQMMQCHPGSPQWDEIWSTHERNRSVSEARRMWTSSAIGLAALAIWIVALVR